MAWLLLLWVYLVGHKNLKWFRFIILDDSQETLFFKNVNRLIDVRMKYEKKLSFFSCFDCGCVGIDFVQAGTCR